MANIENKAVENKAVEQKLETAADFQGLALADFYDRKAKALEKEANELTDENKSHQKKVQMYKFRGLRDDVKAAVALTDKLKNAKVELSPEETKFLNRVMGIYDRTGGGTSVIGEYFKGLDKGKLPLKLFLYMQADGEKLPVGIKDAEFMKGIMNGSIKERWNLNQLNKKLAELKGFKVDGEFLVKE